MNLAISALVLTASITATMTAAGAVDGFTIQPIEITTHRAIAPDGLVAAARGTSGLLTVGFLVRGTHLVGIDEDSLHVEHILRADGADALAKPGGGTEVTFASPSSVDEDGKSGFFSVASDLDLFGKTDGLRIQGTIDVKTATMARTLQSAPCALGVKGTQTFAGFTLTCGVEIKDAMVLEELPQPGKGEERVAIQVTGPLATIKDVSILVAGAEVESLGESEGADEKRVRYVLFPKQPADAKVVVQIVIWSDFTTVTVPFGR